MSGESNLVFRQVKANPADFVEMPAEERFGEIPAPYIQKIQGFMRWSLEQSRSDATKCYKLIEFPARHTADMLHYEPGQSFMNATSTHIRVVEHCGPICVSEDNGSKMCYAVYEALQKGSAVFDFEDVIVLTPAFLNAAVSCLFSGDYDPAFVEREVEFRGLSVDHQKLLDIVISSAKRFQSASAADRSSIVDATARPLSTCQ
jgi:hypothetical protein